MIITRKKPPGEEVAKLIQSGDYIAIPLAVGSCTGQMMEVILDRHEELNDLIISDLLQVYPSSAA